MASAQGLKAWACTSGINRGETTAVQGGQRRQHHRRENWRKTPIVVEHGAEAEEERGTL